MPEFHEREGEHQEWKRKVLAGEADLEEIDTAPYNMSRRRRRRYLDASSAAMRSGCPTPMARSTRCW